MKKNLFWAAIAIALVSCSVEEKPLDPVVADGYKVLTIQAVKDTGESKTAYAGEKTFSWSVGDRISVLCNDGSNNFLQTFEATTASATSAFTATVPANVNLGPKSSSAHRIAMFPASDGHVCDNDWTLCFNIPAEKDFRSASGGHASADIPMFAWGTSNDVYHFSNMTGAAKFSFTGISCSAVKFQFTVPGVKLNGSYGLFYDGGINVDDASNVKWNAASAATDEEKTVTYYGDVVNGGVSFYLPYATGGIWGYSTLTLSDAETGTVLYSNDHVGSINVTKNQIAVLPTIDVGTGSIVTPSFAVNENLSFTESDEDIANPERGLYKMVEYKYPSSQSSWTSATYSLTDTYDANNTLTLTLFYLFDFVDSDQLSSAALTHIGNVFSTVRSSGKKAIVRFAYSNQHEDKFHNPEDIHQEPSLSQIQTHLTQLAPILEANKDVIYVVQAGFIGTYGEWYYTTHFSTFSTGPKEVDPSDNKKKTTYIENRDFTVSGNTVTGYENRAAVIAALLEAVPEERQIELRTPAYKSFYISPTNINSYTTLSGFGTDTDARLSFHNDAFLYGGDDMGTYSYLSDGRAMWRQQSAYLVCGGEAPYSSKDVSEMQGYTKAATQAEIFDYHYSYLHHDTAYHSGNSGGSSLMKHWHQQGWMTDIKKWLGYRLYLDSATIAAESVSSGSTLNVSVKLNNSGAAPIINERPMMLVLLHNGTPTVLAEDLGDPRSVASQGTQTFTANVTLSQDIAAGDQLALWLPDNATNLRSTPAYSVRLANTNVTWSNGYNIFYTF